MIAASSCMEILCIGPVKHVESVHDVFRSVGMNDVHQNNQSKMMRFVDQRFELFRSSTTTAWGKEIRHVVSKAAVISVFLNRHDLNRVVTEFANAWKHLISKF